VRIVYGAFIDMETDLVGQRLDKGTVVIDAAIKGKPAQLRLSEEDARRLKGFLDAALFKLTTGGVHGRG
jgi:hypothetical protein